MLFLFVLQSHGLTVSSPLERSIKILEYIFLGSKLLLYDSIGEYQYSVECQIVFDKVLVLYKKFIKTIIHYVFK